MFEIIAGVGCVLLALPLVSSRYRNYLVRDTQASSERSALSRARARALPVSSFCLGAAGLSLIVARSSEGASAGWDWVVAPFSILAVALLLNVTVFLFSFPRSLIPSGSRSMPSLCQELLGRAGRSPTSPEDPPVVPAVAAASTTAGGDDVRLVTSDASGTPGVLEIVRVRQAWRDRARRYAVLVDGSPAGELSNGQTLQLSLPAGQHTVQARIGPTGSPVTAVEVVGDATVRCLIEPSVGALLDQAGSDDGYLRLVVEPPR